MKKLFALILLATLAMVSCTKDVDSGSGRKGMVDFNISTSIPQEIKTYAEGGGASKVDASTYDMRFILEIYDGDKMVQRMVKTSTVSATANVTFATRLLARKYNFVVWADFVIKGGEIDLCYNTANTLKNVEIKDFVANQAAADKGLRHLRDAYCGAVEVDLTQSGQGVSLKLKRPFGRVEVHTTDMDDIKALTGVADPTSVKIAYAGEIPSKYDVVNGTVVDFASVNEIEMSVASYQGSDNDRAKSYQLSHDYIFAPKAGQSSVGFKITAYNPAMMSDRTLTDVPVKQNVITKLTGDVLTRGGNLVVSFEDMFDATEDVTLNQQMIYTFAIETETSVDKLYTDIDAVFAILKASNVNTEVKFVFTGTIPAGFTGYPKVDAFRMKTYADGGNLSNVKSMEWDFSQATFASTDSPVEIVVDNSFNGTVTLALPTSTSAPDVTLDSKTATGVAISGGNGSNVTVVTGQDVQTPIVIAPGANLGTITANDAVVEIPSDATVGTVTGENASLLKGVSTEAELRAALADKQVKGVKLVADIASTIAPSAINGAAATQDCFQLGVSGSADFDNFVFDGNGHTLSGYALNNVLNVFASNTVIKNLTLMQTEEQKAVTINVQNKKGILNGICVYRANNVTLENVTVYNVGKAGVIVNSSSVQATNLKTYDNAWGGVNVTRGGAPTGGPASAFELVSGTISEPVQIWADLSRAQNQYSIKVPEGWYNGIVASLDGSYNHVYSTTPIENEVATTAEQIISSITKQLEGATVANPKTAKVIVYMTKNITIAIPASIAALNATCLTDPQYSADYAWTNQAACIEIEVVFTDITAETAKSFVATNADANTPYRGVIKIKGVKGVTDAKANGGSRGMSEVEGCVVSLGGSWYNWIQE